MPSDEKARFLLDKVEDRKAVDPVMLDLREKVLLFDFMIVCSGTSDVHIRAIADRVQEAADDERLPRPRVEGESVAEWVLLDFGDVVIHVMNAEARERYRLEQFWSTPQPKGALPPTPSSVGLDGDHAGETDDADALGNFDDEDDLEDLEDDDEAFFEDADAEVEPVEEDDADGAGGSKRPPQAGGR